MNYVKVITIVLGVAALTACTTMPAGPSHMVLPGTGKTWDQFRFDDAECRQFAHAQVGGNTVNQAATNSGIQSAAVGAAVGAIAGAVIGGHNSAGVGAGAGLLVGSAAGANASEQSSYNLQRGYDNGYEQCMYAKGHKIPVSGHLISSPQSNTTNNVSTPPPPLPPQNLREKS